MLRTGRPGGDCTTFRQRRTNIPHVRPARRTRRHAARALPHAHTLKNHVARTGHRPGRTFWRARSWRTGKRRGLRRVRYGVFRPRARLCARVLTPCVVVPPDQVVFAHVQRTVFGRLGVVGLFVLRRTVSGFRVVRAGGVPRRIDLHGDGRRAVMHNHNNTGRRTRTSFGPLNARTGRRRAYNVGNPKNNAHQDGLQRNNHARTMLRDGRRP